MHKNAIKKVGGVKISEIFWPKIVGFSALRGGQKCGIFSSEGGNLAGNFLATLIITRDSEVFVEDLLIC